MFVWSSLFPCAWVLESFFPLIGLVVIKCLLTYVLFFGWGLNKWVNFLGCFDYKNEFHKSRKFRIFAWLRWSSVVVISLKSDIIAGEKIQTKHLFLELFGKSLKSSLDFHQPWTRSDIELPDTTYYVRSTVYTVPSLSKHRHVNWFSSCFTKSVIQLRCQHNRYLSKKILILPHVKWAERF